MNILRKTGVKVAGIVVWTSILPGAQALATQDKLGVARISLANGETTVRRATSNDWIEGTINTPLVQGDTLATWDSAQAEIQFNSANFLRLKEHSLIKLSELGKRQLRLQLEYGTLNYSQLKDGEPNVDIETPLVVIRPTEHGVFRVEVGLDSRTVITVRRGKTEIILGFGTESLDQGKTMIVRADANEGLEFQITKAPQRDDWDHWNRSREKQLQSSNSRRYVSQTIYGIEDLDLYGNWRYASDYGYSWYPKVGLDWSPYRHGRWTWLDYYGWSWVGHEPWAWAPYHYGRWHHHRRLGWGWYPGRIHHRHHWRPALVAFFGYGNPRGFTVNFDYDKVGWVPLAPHEPFCAWYKGRHIRHQCGGRHGKSDRTILVDNNVSIYNTYRNARTHNGATVVNARHFARGQMRSARSLRQEELRQVRLLRGQIPVMPKQESHGRRDPIRDSVLKSHFRANRSSDSASRGNGASPRRTSPSAAAITSTNRQRSHGITQTPSRQKSSTHGRPLISGHYRSSQSEHYPTARETRIATIRPSPQSTKPHFRNGSYNKISRRSPSSRNASLFKQGSRSRRIASSSHKTFPPAHRSVNARSRPHRTRRASIFNRRISARNSHSKPEQPRFESGFRESARPSHPQRSGGSFRGYSPASSLGGGMLRRPSVRLQLDGGRRTRSPRGSGYR